MPYTIPSTDDFFTRFPIFEDKDEDMVAMIIAEAAGNIDQTWRVEDYAPAIMYLAAHMLATDNSDAGTEPDIGGPNIIASESFAGMSVSYQNNSNQPGVSQSQLGLTEYGRRYYALLIKNKPGIAVA